MQFHQSDHHKAVNLMYLARNSSRWANIAAKIVYCNKSYCYWRNRLQENKHKMTDYHLKPLARNSSRWASIAAKIFYCNKSYCYWGNRLQENKDKMTDYCQQWAKLWKQETNWKIKAMSRVKQKYRLVLQFTCNGMKPLQIWSHMIDENRDATSDESIPVRIHSDL